MAGSEGRTTVCCAGEDSRREADRDMRQVASSQRDADDGTVNGSLWRTASGMAIVRGVACMGLALAILGLIAGCAIEDRGPVSTSTSFDGLVHLTADKPVAVRHLAFEVSPPARPINVVLTINAHRFITETTGEFAEDVTVSVRADDPGTTAYAGSPGDARPGAIFSLTELCANGCESGVMVVVRGTGDERPTEDIGISATLSASASSPDLTNASPLGTTLSLVDDEAEQFLGDPPLILDHVASKIAVSEASPTAHIGLRLRAEPQLLSDPLTYPQVGSLTLRVTGDPAAHDQLWNHWAASIGRLTVNGESMGLAPESGAYDIDWLRLCTAGEPCDVEVGVDIEYEDLLFRARVNGSVANESAAPPPPEFRLTLDAVARLEAFDGGELGSDGLTLEVAQ